MIALAGRFASLALLVVLAPSTAAQTQMDESTFDKLLADVHIHEITVDAPTVKVVIRGAKAEGKMGREEHVLCVRSSSDAEYIVVQVLDFKTDDRWAVKSGACDALLAAARRLKEAQGG